MKQILLLGLLFSFTKITTAQKPIPFGGQIPPTKTIYPEDGRTGRPWRVTGPYDTIALKKKRTPIVGTTIIGQAVGNPTDNAIAVSNSGHILQLQNDAVTFAETNGTVNLNTSLNSFLNSLGASSYTYFDPRVLYDPEFDKFVVVIDATFNNTSKVIVGVSDDGNPQSGWNFFPINSNTAGGTGWWDYPTLGMSTADIFVTLNEFSNFSTMSGSFNAVDILQIPKVDLYLTNQGAGIAYALYNDVKDGKNVATTIAPASHGVPQINGNNISYGPGIYSVGISTNYDATMMNFITTSSLFDITDDYVGTPALNIYTASLPKPVTAGVPAFQKGTSTRLDVGDIRLKSAIYQAPNIHFVFTRRYDASHGETVIQYFNFDVSATIPTFNSNEISPSLTNGDEEWFSYPSLCHIGIDETKKDVRIVYLASGAKFYPEIRMIDIDNSNILSSHTIAKVGDNYLTTASGDHRWGDYTDIKRKYNDENCNTTWSAGGYGNNSNVLQTAMTGTLCWPNAINENLLNGKVDISPNPSNNKLNVVLANKQNFEFKILNYLGQLISKGNISNFNSTIDVSSLNNGLYLLILSNNKSNYYAKF
jgi:Secretion system C-terminal sorting domain